MTCTWDLVIFCFGSAFSVPPSFSCDINKTNIILMVSLELKVIGMSGSMLVTNQDFLLIIVLRFVLIQRRNIWGKLYFYNPHSLKYPWLVLTNFAFKQSLTFLVCYNRYNWTCSTSLSSIETNCFQDNISGTFDMSDPVLTFPVSWLQSGNQYLFVLEVSASGLESGNTTQVIDIHGDALEWVNVCCQ